MLIDSEDFCAVWAHCGGRNAGSEYKAATICQVNVSLLRHKELTARVQVEHLVEVLHYVSKFAEGVSGGFTSGVTFSSLSKCSIPAFEQTISSLPPNAALAATKSSLISAGFEMSALIATALPPARSIACTTFPAGAALRE